MPEVGVEPTRPFGRRVTGVPAGDPLSWGPWCRRWESNPHALLGAGLLESPQGTPSVGVRGAGGGSRTHTPFWAQGYWSPRRGPPQLGVRGAGGGSRTHTPFWAQGYWSPRRGPPQLGSVVPEVGVEPTRPFGAGDFESPASAIPPLRHGNPHSLGGVPRRRWRRVAPPRCNFQCWSCKVRVFKDLEPAALSRRKWSGNDLTIPALAATIGTR